MLDINLIITTLIAISTVVAFTYFNKMRKDETAEETTDDYVDQDLTITLLNIHNIVQESDFK